MSSRALRGLGLGVLTLAVASSMSVPASAGVRQSGVAEDKAAAGSGATCYSNAKDVGTFGVMSQNFAPVLDAYDSAAADDLTLRKTCKVRSIQVTGSYSAEGAVDSETVTFYKDEVGRPGKIISSQTRVGTDNGAGSYDIKLKPVTLKKGTYWVSVVANLNPDAGGQWYWTSSNTQKGAAALWENPRGGWQYGCLTWTKIYQCLGAGPGPDLAFSLLP